MEEGMKVLFFVVITFALLNIFLILGSPLFSGNFINIEKPSSSPGDIENLNWTTVILSNENGFRDAVEGGVLTRSFLSGPGTGSFMAEGFEFAKGTCAELKNQESRERIWKKTNLGCGEQLFESEWCARKTFDPSISYTLKFLTWTIGPEGPEQECKGDCESFGNKTAYLRIRS